MREQGEIKPIEFVLLDNRGLFAAIGDAASLERWRDILLASALVKTPMAADLKDGRKALIWHLAERRRGRPFITKALVETAIAYSQSRISGASYKNAMAEAATAAGIDAQAVKKRRKRLADIAKALNGR